LAGISEVGTQSFDFYEGIRIFIPATVAVAAAEALYRTLTGGGSSTLLTENVALAVVAVLFAGLFLYFLDIPTKFIAYRSAQPTEELERLAGTAGNVRAVNAYFVLLDTVMPAQIRARSLYMGSIFRIGVEVILTLATCSFGIFLYSLYAVPTFQSPPSVVEAYCQFAILVLLAIAIITVVLQAKRLRPRISRRAAFGRTCRTIGGSVGWCGLAVLVAGISLTWIASASENPPRPFRVAGPLALISLWLVLHVGGKPLGSNDRTPLDGATNVVLFVTCAVSTVASRIELTSDGSILAGRLEYGGWLSVLVVVSVLLAARGHEKRLKGAYSMQRAWMAMNPGAVTETSPAATAFLTTSRC
jgi:hypothetical protein